MQKKEQEMKFMLTKEEILVYCLAMLVCGIFGVIVFDAVVRDYQHQTAQYWHQSPTQTWQNAPDGWYHVCCGSETEDGWVYFPMCESVPSQLHGKWVSEIYLVEGFDGKVRLKNDVIVGTMEI